MLNQASSTIHSRWLKYPAYFILLLGLLLLLARLLLTPAAQWGIGSWFERNGFQATIDDVYINLTDGKFTLSGLSAKHISGETLSAGKLHIEIEPGQLMDHLLYIRDISIEHASFRLAQSPDGILSVSGYSLTEPSPGNNHAEPASVDINSVPWKALLSAVHLSDISVCYQQFDTHDVAVIDYCNQVESVLWKGPVVYGPAIDITDMAAPPVFIEGQLEINNIHSYNHLLEKSLLNIESIIFKGVNVDTFESINFQQLIIKELGALERDRSTDSSSDTEIISFSDLTIESFSINKLNDIQIGKITLTGPSAYIYIDAEGNNEFSQWLPPVPEPPGTSAESTETPFHFRLGQLSLVSGKSFILIDASLDPPLKLDMRSFLLTLSHMDSNAAEQASSLVLDTEFGEHGTIHMESEFSLLADNPKLDGKGKITALDLRTFSPLARKHISHSIKSGQLDADIIIKSVNGQLDSKLSLVLRQLELRALDKKEAEAFNNDFGLPLNTSLSLLRDRDNSIRLVIPVTGNIKSPEFDPGDAVKKASSKAITAAVMHYYTPFGLVFAAESLIDLATALRFEPVIYEPGTSTLSEAHSQQLDKIAELLLQRPQLNLTLCGFSNLADRNTLFPSTLKEGELTAASTDQLEKLHQLVESRTSGIKKYLVEQGGIGAERLIVCEPEYKNDTTQITGVEIRI